MKTSIIERSALVFVIVIFVCVLSFFFTALSNVDRETALKDKIQLEKAISNAAVSCYALEGSYPPSIEYLMEKYNVQINTERYTVKYELYASNLMPDITVLDNKYEH